MIHLFQALDQAMALDVGSGAVHALDPVAFDALKLMQEQPDADDATLLQTLSATHPHEVAAETLTELRELIRMGYLDTPDDYSGVEALDTGVVKAMCLHAAHDCNLRCQYCFADTGAFHLRNRTLLSVETGKKALDWLVARSGNRINLEVDFFGGEPLMNFPVIRELVAYGRSLEKPHNKHFKFTTTTNGVALTEEIMDFLNKEMDNVVISIDGRREVHDRMRPTPNGKGSYDLILDKAKRFVAKRGQRQYYLRGTYTRYNLDFGNDVLHLADEGFEQLSIEPVVTTPDKEYAIREADLPTVFAEYERLGKEYLQRRADGHWFSFFHFVVDLTGGPCIKKRLTGCGAGNEYVAVTPEGDIYPCHQFVGREGMRMGSVLDGTFDTAMQSRFKHNNVLTKEKCRDCWARFYCSGGCAANAHAFNGDISKPYDLECQLERKRLECAMAIFAAEQENPPQQPHTCAEDAPPCL
ncbi:MAG: thioether cross-link-forming SCIFF peptide maturase [Candidatus Limiplasma sp.]|nr:thioether cross-link-forming SCIFF peptide maturase [Candidatus Limiplasma sp.]